MYIYSGHRGLDFKLSLYLAIFNFLNKLLIKDTPLPLTLSPSLSPLTVSVRAVVPSVLMALPAQVRASLCLYRAI